MSVWNLATAVALLLAVALPLGAGPALEGVKSRGCRNIWVSVNDAAAIERLADAGFNAVTAQVHLLKDFGKSVGADDTVMLREKDISSARLELVRAQARECARRKLLYMPYINQLSDFEVMLLKDRHYRHVVNSQGVEGGIAPCPLERKDWLGLQLPQMLALARILAEEGCEGGAMLEGETYCAGDIYPGYTTERQSFCHCDYCWGRFLSRLPAHDRPEKLRPAERYPWLSRKGLLWRYQQSERDEIAALMRELAAEVRKVMPEFVFGMYPCSVTWYSDGIALGLGSKKLPFLMYSNTEYYSGFNPRRGASWDWNNCFSSTDQMLHLKRLGASCLYQTGLSVGTYWPERLGLEMALALHEGQGFWLYWGGTLLAADGSITVQSEGGSEYVLRKQPSRYWPPMKLANNVGSRDAGGQASAFRQVWNDVVFRGPEGNPVVWHVGNPPPYQPGAPPTVDRSQSALVYDLNRVTPEPKSEAIEYEFAQTAGERYLFGANLRYRGPSDGARVGLGWSYPGHVEGDGRQIYRYVNDLLFPRDGWVWLVRPLETVKRDQQGWAQFRVQPNPGKLFLRSLFLSPSSVTALVSPVLRLADGVPWGRVTWKMEGAERCYTTVDVFEADTDHQLYADVPNGFDLQDISRIYGLRAINLKFTCHAPAGEKARLTELRVYGAK